MSLVLTVTVTCEHDGCPTRFVDDGWPKDVRDRARRAGWSSKPDRCPAHPPGSDDPGLTLFDLSTGEPT